jgi:hypothetical protein
MKLTTNDIIVLFQALTELRGAPNVVINERGQKQVVYEPYDMGPKFKWNAAKNRSILRRHVDANDEQVMDFRRGLQKLQRELAARNDDPKANQLAIQQETAKVNDEISKLAKEEIEVEGLLLLPATGLNIKTSKIPPTVIEELMPLIDGVPDFDEPAEKKK